MFLLMIHQITPYFLLGLMCALLFFGMAKRLDMAAFDRSAPRMVRVLVMGMFVLFQLICWRYFYFFRDPERRIPSSPAIVAPADGFVVYIRQVHQGKVPLAIKEGNRIPLQEIVAMGDVPREGILVGIFMTPMSVHVNRFPIQGKILQRAYSAGTSFSSMLPMSLRTIFSLKPYEKGSFHILHNERETLLIEGRFPLYMTRIADPYVHKIVTWKSIGSLVQQGERMGLIKMGSQTDIFFPASVEGAPVKISVHEGQYVYAGSTVIATFLDEK